MGRRREPNSTPQKTNNLIENLEGMKQMNTQLLTQTEQ
jgi:hypothetical protein